MHAPVMLGFLSGSPGMGELLLVFAVVLILFGPRRLPEIAKLIGRAMEELRRASQEFRDQLMRIDIPSARPTLSVSPSPVSEEAPPATDVTASACDGSAGESAEPEGDADDPGERVAAERLRDGRKGGRDDGLAR